MAFLVVAFLYSALIEPKYVVGRYDLAAWPSITIALAALIGADARRHAARPRVRVLVATMSTAVLLACSGATVVAARSIEPSNQAEVRARRIVAVVQNDDLIISVAMYRWFMEFEWHRQGFFPSLISFPAKHDQQLCWDNPESELANPDELARDAQALIARIDQTLRAGDDVWLLAHGEPSGGRWEVDQHLFAALLAAGIEIRLHDETTGLAQLSRPIPLNPRQEH